MKRIALVLALAGLAASPLVAAAQTSPATIGVGASGYDFIIGTWRCVNAVPSAMGGPATTTLTGSRAAGGIAVKLQGQGFESAGYVVYDSKTRTWWNPTAYANGASSNESSKQSGKQTVWTGTVHDASGSTPLRDTYTAPSLKVYRDVTEVQTAGAWKAVAKLTCTKT